MHVAGNASYRNAPGIVTIILHGAGVTVKRNIRAAGCAARKSPQSMGAATGLIFGRPYRSCGHLVAKLVPTSARTHSQNSRLVVASPIPDEIALSVRICRVARARDTP